MTSRRRPSALRGLAAPLAGLALIVGMTAACSSDEVASAPVEAIEAASSAAGAVEMKALCEQMITEGMSPEDATALAEQNGYVARVGTLEGQPQAVTMDYREDRFTFDVEGGMVVACTYG